MALPKVSGVLPVGHGGRFFRVAMNAFLNQLYEGELELIIVDNSDEPIESLLPDDDRIIYHRCERKPVGALRNFGTDLATGDVIVSIDEDDWSSPDRVHFQVNRLLDTGKAVTGFHSLFYYAIEDGSTYKYHYSPNSGYHPPYACGSSQMYTKAWWSKHKFEEIGIEDFAFQKEALDHNQLDSCDGYNHLVARAHRTSICFPTQLGTHIQFPAVPKTALPQEFYEAIKTKSKTRTTKLQES